MAIAELDALAKAIPGLNQQVIDKQQAAQRIQARAAVSQAAPGLSSTQVAQQVAAPLVQAQQQVAQQGQQQVNQNLGAIGQQMVGQQAASNQASLLSQAGQNQQALADTSRSMTFNQQQEANKQQQMISNKEIQQAQRLQTAGIQQDNKLLQLDLNTRKELSRIGADLEDKLFTDRKRFEQDEAGRKFTNERQLADYAALTATNSQQFAERMRDMQQAAQRKALLLEAAHKRILDEVNYRNKFDTQDISGRARLEMAQEAQKAKQAAARAQAQANMITNLIQGAGAGAAAGASFGPMGVAIGAMTGAAGGLLASKQ